MPEFVPENKTVAIIAGFPRCGTTALYRYLGAHPDVCPSIVKETNFFVEQRKDTVGEYSDLFAHCKERKIWLEASPAYVFYDGVQKEIYEYYPNAKIIFLLRDPTYRFFSFYRKKAEMFSGDNLFNVLNDVMRQGTKQIYDSEARRLAARQIRLGIYVNSIKKYLSVFEPEQIVMIFLEELESTPFSVMQRVCRFLDLNSEIYRTFDFSPENESLLVRSKHIYRAALTLNHWMEPFLNHYPAVRKVARAIHHRINARGKPKPPQDAVKLLNDFYREPNRQLREFVLIEFAHWYTTDSLPAWLREA